MWKGGHRALGIVVEGGLVGGVVTMGGRRRAGMGQKSAEDRGTLLILRPCDV